MKTTATFIAIAVGITGCATTGSNFAPMVDLQGKTQAQYSTDLADCQVYAKQLADGAQSAMAGAVVGALLGVALAAAAGSQYSRTATARVGALTGAVGAGARGNESQQDVIRRCLAGRGYNVLN